MANRERAIQCMLAVARPNSYPNPECLYRLVYGGKVRCYHYIPNTGKQSDAPSKCSRLSHRQRTMPMGGLTSGRSI